MAIKYVIITDTAANAIVFPTRPAMSVDTGNLKIKLCPKSPCKALPIQRKYCSYQGSFNPAASRMASITFGSWFGLINPVNGSPGIILANRKIKTLKIITCGIINNKRRKIVFHIIQHLHFLTLLGGLD